MHRKCEKYSKWISAGKLHFASFALFRAFRVPPWWYLSKKFFQKGREMQTTFTDKNGNHWDLDLTFETIRRLQTWQYSKTILNHHSLTAPSREMLTTLLEDAGALFEMVWSIIEPQSLVVWPERTIEEREVEFLKGIGINEIETVQKVFFEVLSFFSPEVSSIRAFHQKMKQTALETAKAKLEKAETQVREKVEAELERQVQSLTAEIESLNIGDVSSLPDSRGSTSAD